MSSLKTRVLAEPVLVGRESELEELRHSLDSAIKGKGTTVFVSGEAGVGKTRLISEFLGQVNKKEVTILTGWCLGNAAVPYFPFFEAFNRYFSGQHDEQVQVKNWFLGPSMGAQIITPQVWKDQTFTAVANTLSSISARHPVILFIDDLHWADSASLALLHYLARTIDSEKTLLMAAFRGEQLGADAEGRQHPLVETLRLMRREDLVREINVISLDQSSVSVLAKNILGGSLQSDLAEKLAEESRGNPLFVVESLRMLNERNSLILEHNEWGLASSAIGIPPKIKDIVLQRLGAVSRTERNVLDAASVIGEKFGAELLASVLGQDCIEIIKVLERISKESSLVGFEGEVYHFDNGRTRDAIYDDISPALKRVYHAKVAEKLESTSQNGKLPLGDLAYQFLQAGNKDKAAKFAMAAGQNALANWSNAEAIKHFSFVAETLGEKSERAQEKMVALEGLGDAYFASGNFQQAMTIFEQLADLQSDAARLRALRKASMSSYYQGDVPKMKMLIEKAEAIAVVDRLETGRILSLKSGVAGGLDNGFEVTFQLNDQATKIFEEEYALSDAGMEMHFNGYGSAMLGQLESGVTTALRSIAIWDELKDFRSQIEAYSYAGCTFQACTLSEYADKMFAKAAEVNEQYKIWDYAGIIPAYVMESFGLIEKDIQRAILIASKALECFDKTDSRLYAGAVYEMLVMAYAFAEDTNRAEVYYQTLMNLPEYILSNAASQILSSIMLGVYHTVKKNYERANAYFSGSIKAFSANPFMEASSRRLFSWSLARQGRKEEAMSQLEQAKKIVEITQKRFSHVNIQPGLITSIRPEVNHAFPLRLDLVNASTIQGSIVKIENLLVPGLEIVEVSPNCLIHGGAIELKEKTIAPFGVKTVKLTAKATKPQIFALSPTVTFVDDLGETKKSSCRLFTIIMQPPALRATIAPALYDDNLSQGKARGITTTAQPVQSTYEALPGRTTTGHEQLDMLLLGGLPEKHAVVLTAPSSDERELLIRRFLEAGVEAGETTFSVTGEAANTKLAVKYPSSFCLFLCNPQADTMVQSAPNVFKLKGVENLTDIDIALTKAFRTMSSSAVGPKRICIDIVSDALLQHRAVTTRRWLSALLPTLISKGFTVLAIINSQMHPREEVEAIVGLFDGEISLYEKETPEGTTNFLKVKKMTGQKYLKDETVLREKQKGGFAGGISS